MPSPCTVTAKISDVSNQSVQGSFVRLILRNFKGFVPRVLGTDVIVETQVDLVADGSGNISSPIWGNDNIDPINTFYTVEWWSSGRITSQANFLIIGASFNLNTAAILNPPNPPSTVATPLLLQTNGVNNGSQIKLNLHSSDASITLIDDGTGNIDLKAVGGGGGGAVSSVFGRTGTVVAQAGDYSVGQITGAAPLASPNFTGSPTAPTPATGNNSTLLATTAFVKAQGYLTSAPVTSVFGRTGAVAAQSGDYAAAQVTNAQDNSVSQAANTFLAAPSGGAGTPSFRVIASADLPNLVGDVTGPIGANSVVKLQGRSLAATAPSNGQVIAWSNANNDWEPTSLSAIPSANASQLQSVNISTKTPFDQDILKYSKANNDWEPTFQPAFYFEWIADVAQSSPLNAARGLYTSVNQAGTVTAIVATSSLPVGFKWATSATGTTTGAGINLGGNMATGAVNAPMQLFRRIVFKLLLNQTTNMRVWIGMGVGVSAGATTGWSSDAPATNFVGFRYSTHAGDTKYQCVTQTGAASQTVNPETTASHVDTNVHTFELRWDDTNVLFLIDGTQVGSQNTNLPASTVGLCPFVEIDNVSVSNAVAFQLYYMAGVTKSIL